MEQQPAYVELEFIDCASDEARRRLAGHPLVNQLRGAELIAISSRGEVWIGPAAFVACLWALVGWREWSLSLADGALSGLARLFFALVSRQRRLLSAWFAHTTCPEGHCGVPTHRRRPLDQACCGQQQ